MADCPSSAQAGRGWGTKGLWGRDSQGLFILLPVPQVPISLCPHPSAPSCAALAVCSTSPLHFRGLSRPWSSYLPFSLPQYPQPRNQNMGSVWGSESLGWGGQHEQSHEYRLWSRNSHKGSCPERDPPKEGGQGWVGSRNLLGVWALRPVSREGAAMGRHLVDS